MPDSNDLDPNSGYYEKKTIIIEYPNGISRTHEYWVPKYPMVINANQLAIYSQTKVAAEQSFLEQCLKDTIQNTSTDNESK
jgi:hypothetical protein